MKKFFVFILVLLAVSAVSFLHIKNLFETRTESDKEINVVFAIDNNYVLPNLLTIKSILAQNHSGYTYNFYIIEENISKWNKFKMKYYVRHKHHNIEFIEADTDILEEVENLAAESKEHTHVSRISFARLQIAKKLSDTIDKVIYLDSDLLVLTDLSKLYNIDISDYAAAMTIDVSNIWDIYPPDLPLYVNPGVILVNLKYWRDNDVTQKFIDFIHSGKKMPKLDQTVINEVILDKTKIIDIHWNNEIFQDVYAIANFDWGIIHYIGDGNKPWLTDNFSDRLPQELYYESWKHSCFNIYKIQFDIKMFFEKLKNKFKKEEEYSEEAENGESTEETQSAEEAEEVQEENKTEE